MIEVYRPKQFRRMAKSIKKTPKWFLLGGPGNGIEAQCAAKHWPGVKILACEPSLPMRRWQLEHVYAWPDGALLLPFALWSSEEVGIKMRHPSPGDNPGGSSLMLDRPGDMVEVNTTTLDALDRHYGPFDDAVLWLDIEGSEYDALVGAKALFGRGAITAVTLEFLTRLDVQNLAVDKFLRDYGFLMHRIWNQNNVCQDRVYLKE